MTSFDEESAINRVADWVAKVRHKLNKQWSRGWLAATLLACLRDGSIPVVKVVEAADDGDEIADEALRKIGAELMERPRVNSDDSQMILAYFKRAGLRAPLKRGRGIQWYDSWKRNIGICVLIQLACKEFEIRPTRNSATKTPSGCSLVAAALKRNGFDLSERTIQQHIWLGLPGALSQKVFEGYFVSQQKN